jgi:FdhD protein
VNAYAAFAAESRTDAVAVEEPLEIVLGTGPADARTRRTLAITMRTPTGHDEELVAGFLFAEGVIRTRADLERLTPGVGPNAVWVDLRPGVPAPPAADRHFTTHSSCGVCGKTSLDTLAVRTEPLAGADRPVLDPATVHRLSGTLREAQPTFERTGGLHAAALFDFGGRLCSVREDVGRHNALDKLIGAELLAGRVPLGERVLLVSGRASFELTQKAVAAGIPVLAAVGAPSSLAVDLATRFGLTLLGFVRDHRFNVYTHPGRLRG